MAEVDEGFTLGVGGSLQDKKKGDWATAAAQGKGKSDRGVGDRRYGQGHGGGAAL